MYTLLVKNEKQHSHICTTYSCLRIPTGSTGRPSRSTTGQYLAKTVVEALLQLASCLIYARELLEYVIFILWVRNSGPCLQDVTVREIRRRKGAHFPYSP